MSETHNHEHPSSSLVARETQAFGDLETAP